MAEDQEESNARYVQLAKAREAARNSLMPRWFVQMEEEKEEEEEERSEEKRLREEEEIIAGLVTAMYYRRRRRRTAHAYLSVAPVCDDAEAKAKAPEDPAATIRGAIHAKLPDLQFKVLPPPPGLVADRSVRFCSQDDREEAMEFQPFVLGSSTVWLVRQGQGETSCKFNENQPSGEGD